MRSISLTLILALSLMLPARAASVPQAAAVIGMCPSAQSIASSAAAGPQVAAPNFGLLVPLFSQFPTGSGATGAPLIKVLFGAPTGNNASFYYPLNDMSVPLASGGTGYLVPSATKFSGLCECMGPILPAGSNGFSFVESTGTIPLAGGASGGTGTIKYVGGAASGVATYDFVAQNAPVPTECTTFPFTFDASTYPGFQQPATGNIAQMSGQVMVYAVGMEVK